MGPYYPYGISIAWDLAPQWGKRQNGVKQQKKKKDRRAKHAERRTGEEEPPFSLPRPPLRSHRSPIFFLFFPHCEPGPRLGFPALVPQKQVLFLAI